MRKRGQGPRLEEGWSAGGVGAGAGDVPAMQCGCGQKGFAEGKIPHETVSLSFVSVLSVS